MRTTAQEQFNAWLVDSNVVASFVYVFLSVFELF